MLIIAERTAAGAISSNVKDMIAKMNEDLTKIVEDFMRAVNVETLYKAKTTGKHSLSKSSDGPFSIVLCRARASASST